MKHTGRIMPQALKNLFRKPATMLYPASRADVFTDIRGKLSFDASKCVGCKMCTRDCPAKAIEIIKIGDKQFKAILSLDHCVFCGQCVDSCKPGALQCTDEFELAELRREDMKVEL